MSVVGGRDWGEQILSERETSYINIQRFMMQVYITAIAYQQLSLR